MSEPLDTRDRTGPRPPASDRTIGTGNPLEHADLSVPPLHIPDGKGGCYKTELVLERSLERVVKIHWWHAPDPRREPHNHPWEFFKSTILSGGYTETRHWKTTDGDALEHVVTESRTYREGDVNLLPHSIFHTVDEVLPGTVTRMETGPLVEGGGWGYLDAAGNYSPQEPDPAFFEILCAMNPHKRPPESPQEPPATLEA